MLLFIPYYVIFPTNACKPTFAHAVLSAPRFSCFPQGKSLGMELLGKKICTCHRLLILGAKLLPDKAPCAVALPAFSASRIPGKSSKSLGMIQPLD